MKEFIAAVGALAEMCGFFREELLKQGFSRKEAMELVQTYIESTLPQKPRESGH